MQNIGAYSVLKTIGKGTFGKVKLGVHQATSEQVAIKVLEKKKICDVSDVERVSREIHILKLIRHPNIIQLYEIIETPKRIYLIMEYANGGELFDYIVENTKLRESLACKFYQQLIAGIEYIHKLGVVHRDLKPENLLLDHNFNIKIVDFGLSNTYVPEELLKTACGSPCYAAPEMIAGNKYNGLKADIWSSGVILFAMVCGYLPFEDPNTSKLYKKILAGEYELPGFISDSCKSMIKKLLNTDPDCRLGIEEIRKEQWFNQCKQEIYPGLLVGYDNILVDKSILKGLARYKYDTEHAEKCIEANKHNSVTAAYYLLLKKHILNGGSSVADIRKSPSPKPQEKKERFYGHLTYTPHPPLLELSYEPALPLQIRRRRVKRKDFFSTGREKAPSPKVARTTGRTPVPGRLRQKLLGSTLEVNRRLSPHPNRRRFRTSRLSML